MKKPKRVTVVDATIYLKSGNKIELDRLDGGSKWTSVGDVITGVSEWRQYGAKDRMVLSTLALNQIEAVVTHKTRKIWVWA